MRRPITAWRKISISAAAAFVLALLGPTPVRAQTDDVASYPNRPVRIIIAVAIIASSLRGLVTRTTQDRRATPVPGESPSADVVLGPKVPRLVGEMGAVAAVFGANWN